MKKSKLLIPFIALTSLTSCAIPLVSCGGGGETPPEPEPTDEIKLKKVTTDEYSLWSNKVLIEKGKSYTIVFDWKDASSLTAVKDAEDGWGIDCWDNDELDGLTAFFTADKCYVDGEERTDDFYVYKDEWTCGLAPSKTIGFTKDSKFSAKVTITDIRNGETDPKHYERAQLYFMLSVGG